MEKYDVVFYEKDDGCEPDKDFIMSLADKMQAKMLRTITLLQNNGTALREPYAKALDDGIFELRAKVGSNISRVLYFFFVGRRIVLTNGFIKKSRKTPLREKERALRYRKEYLSRKENRQ